MLKAIDIKAELAKLPFLHNRGKDTTEAEKQAAFTTLAPYRDGGIFSGSFSGISEWERHEKGDETPGAHDSLFFMRETLAIAALE